MRMRNCEVIMRLSSSFQRGSELADKSINAPFSQKSAHIFSYAFLHSAKFGIEAASGFDGENSHVNSRVSEFESNSNSCGVCVGLNFAPSENLTAAKYLVESSSREITAAFFSGVSSALLCFCGEFQSPERLAVCASEYGNEKITRSFPGFKSFDDIFTDTASRSGCETVVTRAFFPSAENWLSTAPLYIFTICHVGDIELESSRFPSVEKIAKAMRPRFSLCGFAASHSESCGLAGSGRESGKFIIPLGEFTELPLNFFGSEGGGVECHAQSESVFCAESV